MNDISGTFISLLILETFTVFYIQFIDTYFYQQKNETMMGKSKIVCFLVVIVTFMNFCTANDVANEEESGRALSLAAANHPAGNI